MPFSLEKCVSDIVNSELITSLFTHPVYTSLLIVFIVLLIMYFTFKEEISNTSDDFPFIGLLFRAGIYITLSTLAVVFMHNKILHQEYEKTYENKIDRDIVNAGISNKEGSYEDVQAILGAFKESENTKLNEVPINTEDLEKNV